jgi:hypothetical protein
MSAQDLIDDCRTVGIVFPDKLETVDYELLNAFNLLIYLQNSRTNQSKHLTDPEPV